jgi:hypothetical protein
LIPVFGIGIAFKKAVNGSVQSVKEKSEDLHVDARERAESAKERRKDKFILMTEERREDKKVQAPRDSVKEAKRKKS